MGYSGSRVNYAVDGLFTALRSLSGIAPRDPYGGWPDPGRAGGEAGQASELCFKGRTRRAAAGLHRDPGLLPGLWGRGGEAGNGTGELIAGAASPRLDL